MGFTVGSDEIGCVDGDSVGFVDGLIDGLTDGLIVVLLVGLFVESAPEIALEIVVGEYDIGKSVALQYPLFTTMKISTNDAVIIRVKLE